jgi:hypothetical protein
VVLISHQICGAGYLIIRPRRCIHNITCYRGRAFHSIVCSPHTPLNHTPSLALHVNLSTINLNPYFNMSSRKAHDEESPHDDNHLQHVRKRRKENVKTSLSTKEGQKIWSGAWERAKKDLPECANLPTMTTRIRHAVNVEQDVNRKPFIAPKIAISSIRARLQEHSVQRAPDPDTVDQTSIREGNFGTGALSTKNRLSSPIPFTCAFACFHNPSFVKRWRTEHGHRYATSSRVSSHGEGILASGLRTRGHGTQQCSRADFKGYGKVVQGAQTTSSLPVVGKVDFHFHCSHCLEEHNALFSDHKCILPGMNGLVLSNVSVSHYNVDWIYQHGTSCQVFCVYMD